MPGKAQILGPFKGGLNNVGEVSSIDPTQCVILDNFDIDTDGSLLSRPPIVAESPSMDTGTASLIQPLGYYVRSDGVTFLVATNLNATWVYEIDTKVWTLIWAHVASSFVQYDNKIVLCSESVAGGYWEAGVFTSTPSMPTLSQIVVYGERFWGFGAKGSATATTIFFSDLTVISPADSIYNWTVATNFFTVGKGDGQWITCIISDPNALLIYRNGSTYQFTYPSSPAQGTLRTLNNQIGADNRYSVGRYQNYYLVLNAGYLYQFINYLYYPRNEKIVRFQRSPLGAAIAQETALSILGQRAIVYYYGSVYVYNIVTGVWATWSSTLGPEYFMQIPTSSVVGDQYTALVATGLVSPVTATQALRRITDGVFTGSAGEQMTCSVRTKAFYFDDPGIIKRMMYWTISYRSSSGVDAIATPVDIVQNQVTWNELSTHTWNDLNKGTWNNLLVVTPVVQDDIDFPTLAPVQGLAKVHSPIRFKTVYFDMQLSTDGTASTAPARIFNLTAYLKEHARAGAKVS